MNAQNLIITIWKKGFRVEEQHIHYIGHITTYDAAMSTCSLSCSMNPVDCTVI